MRIIQYVSLFIYCLLFAVLTVLSFQVEAVTNANGISCSKALLRGEPIDGIVYKVTKPPFQELGRVENTVHEISQVLRETVGDYHRLEETLPPERVDIVGHEVDPESAVETVELKLIYGRPSEKSQTKRNGWVVLGPLTAEARLPFKHYESIELQTLNEPRLHAWMEWKARKFTRSELMSDALKNWPLSPGALSQAAVTTEIRPNSPRVVMKSAEGSIEFIFSGDLDEVSIEGRTFELGPFSVSEDLR